MSGCLRLAKLEKRTRTSEIFEQLHTCRLVRRVSKQQYRSSVFCWSQYFKSIYTSERTNGRRQWARCRAAGGDVTEGGSRRYRFGGPLHHEHLTFYNIDVLYTCFKIFELSTASHVVCVHGPFYHDQFSRWK